jgi:hypothetical protein
MFPANAARNHATPSDTVIRFYSLFPFNFERWLFDRKI